QAWRWGNARCDEQGRRSARATRALARGDAGTRRGGDLRAAVGDDAPQPRRRPVDPARAAEEGGVQAASGIRAEPRAQAPHPRGRANGPPRRGALAARARLRGSLPEAPWSRGYYGLTRGVALFRISSTRKARGRAAY